MKDKLVKLWKDPVWSKVIATSILGIAAILFQFKNLLFIKINLWIVLILLATSSIFIFLFSKNKKQFTFEYDLEALELDKKLFNHIRNDLLTKDVLANLHHNNFSNDSFLKENFDFLHKTISESENPQFEFLNSNLENSKNELITAIKQFQTTSLGRIYSAPSKSRTDYDYLGIPKDWDDKRFFEAMDAIEIQENNVYLKTENFLKLGRRILKI